MRKQTKLVAVASAAALLAIGASMTSFAAAGWVEEDGVWYYYDSDGNRVEDSWKRSGDNWYYLDSEEGGAMATDKLIEDDDALYYVDSTGAMVKNTWVKVVNEEQDDDDDWAEYHFYYMQGTGKAYKAVGDNTRFRTIDGKRYAFDEDGKMMYGWVSSDHERVDNEDWADNGLYYMGGWDDGAMKTGWQKIGVIDAEDDDEDKEFWFYFKSNGKKEYNTDGTKTIKEKKVNGKRYGFDDRGVMVFEWTIATGTGYVPASSSSWKYFNSPEDGARATKGWFKVVAPDDDNDNTFKDYDESYGSFAAKDADDENDRWYYADGDGNLAVGEIKKIKGKYYGFRPEGTRGAAMLNGLVFMKTDGKGKILNVWDDSVDSDELDHIIKEEDYHDDWGVEVYSDPYTSLYYFGNDEDSDGALKTGNVSINLDGDSYNFQFSKSGGAEGKGKGLTGIDDEKYIYKYGLKIKADSDDKYQVVKVYNCDPAKKSKVDVGSANVKVYKVDSADLRLAANDIGQNKDGDNVSALAGQGKTWDSSYYLVNTAGTVSKKKSAAKDGADWFFYVNKEKEIVAYTNNKTLDDKPSDGYVLGIDFDNWDDWRSSKTVGGVVTDFTIGFDDAIEDHDFELDIEEEW